MTKQIKFNLKLDGHDVRDLDGLLNNLNIDDLYEYFLSTLLLRWLEVRGYQELAAQVRMIPGDAPERAIKEGLLRIFAPDQDNLNTVQRLSDFEFGRKVRHEAKPGEETDSQVSLMISLSFEEYEDLLRRIIKDSDDFSVVKSCVDKILSEYGPLFCADYMRFWDIMAYVAPLAIFAVLMNKDYRQCFVCAKEEGSIARLRTDLTVSALVKLLVDKPEDRPDAYFKIPHSNLIPPTREAFNKDLKTLVRCDSSTSHFKVAETLIPWESKHYLLNYLCSFRANTKSEWVNVEATDDREFLILCVPPNGAVRSHGRRNQKLTNSDVEGRFPILRGIDFSNSGLFGVSHRLIYMEI